MISDLHVGAPGSDTCHGDIGDILLHRAVAYLNDLVRPDVTLLAGDLLDAGEAPGADVARDRLQEILAYLKGPRIVIPGNHDGNENAFYRSFRRSPEILDVAGMRVLPFIDAERPGYCAVRSARDLGRFLRAREGFDGPIIALRTSSMR